MPEKKNTIGRFEIIEKIGEGPIGAVYKALDPVIRRTVAIKVIKLYALEETTTFAEVFEKIYRVVRTSTSLNHPNICIIYDLSEEKKIPYITMEYVDGHDLESLLAKKHQFKRAELLNILQQTADALDFAHKKNVIHQDLKSTNILLSPDLHVKITDFGIAGLDEIAAAQTKKLLSIPFYISPEQALGERVSPSSDLFSLGVVIYHLLSGQLPFPGTTAANAIMMIARDHPSIPADLDQSGITRDDWESFFSIALAKAPNQRFRSGREMYEAVSSILPASDQTYYPFSFAGAMNDTTGKLEKPYVADAASPTLLIDASQILHEESAAPNESTSPPAASTLNPEPAQPITTPVELPPIEPKTEPDIPPLPKMEAPPLLEPAVPPVPEEKSVTKEIALKHETVEKEPEPVAIESPPAFTDQVSPFASQDFNEGQNITESDFLPTMKPAPASTELLKHPDPLPPVVEIPSSPPEVAQAPPTEFLQIPIKPIQEESIQPPESEEIEESAATVIQAFPPAPPKVEPISAPEPPKVTETAPTPPPIVIPVPPSVTPAPSPLISVPPPISNARPSGNIRMQTEYPEAPNAPTVIQPLSSNTPGGNSNPESHTWRATEHSTPPVSEPITPAKPPVSPPPPAAPQRQEVRPAAGAPNMKRYYYAAIGVAVFIAIVWLAIMLMKQPAKQETEIPPARPTETPTESPTKPVTNPPVQLATVGSLTITSEPTGATVFIADSEKGVTPLEVPDLAFGTYTVKLQLKGFQDAQQDIELKADNPNQNIPVVMQKAAALVGTLFVDSEPQGAIIVVGNRVLGITPKSLPNTKVGKYNIVLKKDGYQDFSESVRVAPDKKITLKGALIEIPKPKPPPEPPKPTAPEVRVGQLVNLSDPNVVGPKAIHKVYPKYPEAAKFKKMEGTVKINVLVDENGQVIDMKVVKSAHPILDDAVLNAYKQWTFQPATKKGVRVKVWMPFSMTFQASTH